MDATSMNSMSISLDRYAARSMETVHGYLSSLDAGLIAALLSYQDEKNFRGHLCEIGVHHGRLFLLLALARRAGRASAGHRSIRGRRDKRK